MADETLTTEDIAAALSAFAIGFTAAMMSPHNQTGDEVLVQLANEIDDLIARAPGTPAAAILQKTVEFLLRSER